MRIVSGYPRGLKMYTFLYRNIINNIKELFCLIIFLAEFDICNFKNNYLKKHWILENNYNQQRSKNSSEI